MNLLKKILYSCSSIVFFFSGEEGETVDSAVQTSNNSNLTRANKRSERSFTQITNPSKYQKTRDTIIAKQTRKVFKKGDLCFAKVKGFVEWPGLIIALEEKIAWVKFFNSNQL